VKVLLTFLLATFLLAVWSANHSRPSRAWSLAVVSLFVAAAFLSQRVIG
jgi:hypothetical protein